MHQMMRKSPQIPAKETKMRRLGTVAGTGAFQTLPFPLPVLPASMTVFRHDSRLDIRA